jgi:hypothetical protein
VLCEWFPKRSSNLADRKISLELDRRLEGDLWRYFRFCHLENVPREIMKSLYQGFEVNGRTKKRFHFSTKMPIGFSKRTSVLFFFPSNLSNNCTLVLTLPPTHSNLPKVTNTSLLTLKFPKLYNLIQN